MTDVVQIMARAICRGGQEEGQARCKPDCDCNNADEYGFYGFMPEAREVLSALDAAGYAVVPKEPTPEMIVAGQDEHDNCVDHGWESNADGERFDYTTISPDAPFRVYKAMLQASLSDTGREG